MKEMRVCAAHSIFNSNQLRKKMMDHYLYTSSKRVVSHLSCTITIYSVFKSHEDNAAGK